MPDNINSTEINTETLETIVSELTTIETDLIDIEKSINEKDTSLVETWEGNAKLSFLCASTYAQCDINRIMSCVGAIYDILVKTCSDRILLDQNASDAATIPEE